METTIETHIEPARHNGFAMRRIADFTRSVPGKLSTLGLSLGLAGFLCSVPLSKKADAQVVGQQPAAVSDPLLNVNG